MDGRKEKRTPRTLRVLLSSGTQPVVAEYASTENVSPYGARIRTDRPWKRDTSVLIKSCPHETRRFAQGGRRPCSSHLSSPCARTHLDNANLAPTHARGSAAFAAILASRAHSVSKFSIHGMQCSEESGDQPSDRLVKNLRQRPGNEQTSQSSQGSRQKRAMGGPAAGTRP